MNTNRSTKRLAGLGVVALLALAACGDDDSSSESPTTAASSATSAAPGTTVADGGLYGDSTATTAPATTDAPEGTDAPATTEAATETTTAAADGEAMVATAETDLGTILVDAGGRTLYAFTNDTAGEPTCVEGCAEAWPPAIVEGELAVGDLDASVFTLVEHPAGGQQLKAGDWPLYLFAGDTAPGDVTGQGSGDVWFVVGPDGAIIE